MDYDELLLKLQRFAGDGEGYEVSGGDAAPGFDNDISGDTAGGGDDQVEANSEEMENTQETLHQVEGGMQGDQEVIHNEIAKLDGGAMDEQDQEELQDAMNTARDQLSDFTAAIGTLATFAGSVLEAYRANSEDIHNEITEWTGSFKSLLIGISQGLTGKNADGSQVEMGSITKEEYQTQSTENANQIMSGIVTVSQGTRQIVTGVVNQIASGGRYYTSTTGVSPIGAFKNLVSGIVNIGANNTATGGFVSRLLGGFTTTASA